MFKLIIIVVMLANPTQSISGNVRETFKTVDECEKQFDTVRAEMQNLYGKFPGGIEIYMKCYPVGDPA